MVPASARRYLDGIHDREYDQLPGVRATDLKLLATASPAHARCRTKNDPTPAMLQGLLVHCLALQPDSFARQFVSVNVSSRSTVAWRDAAEKASPGQHVVLQKDREAASLVAGALYSHEGARTYLEADGVCERVFQWTQDGVACKCRTDKVLNDGTLIELKTTRSLDPRSWANDFAKFAYHLQLAHYHNGLTEVYGQLPPKVVVLAIETAPPYDVGVFVIGDDVLEQGRLMLDRALSSYRLCQESGKWPGRYPEEVPFVLPMWAVEDDGSTGISFEGDEL